MTVRPLSAGASARLAPSLVVPPAALGIQGNNAVWFNANWDLALRFDLAAGGVYRYALWRCGVQSGNVQLSVVRYTGTGDLPTYERVMTSGIIACPAAGDIRTDMGATYLPPGRYGLSFWADNVVVQTQHNNQQKVRSLRQAHHLANGLAGGVPVRGAATFLTNRWLDIALEGDV